MDNFSSWLRVEKGEGDRMGEGICVSFKEDEILADMDKK
jgi:hypothetical protein